MKMGTEGYCNRSNMKIGTEGYCNTLPSAEWEARDSLILQCTLASGFYSLAAMATEFTRVTTDCV